MCCHGMAFWENSDAVYVKKIRANLRLSQQNLLQYLGLIWARSGIENDETVTLRAQP